MTTSGIYIAVLALLSFKSSNCAKLLNCQRENIKFEKIIGVKPANNFHPLLLHEGDGGPSTLQCIAKCAANDECLSFVLYFKNSSCFWFRNEVHEQHEEEQVYDPDVAWFAKTCLKVRRKCDSLWTFERVPGAILIGNNTKKLTDLMSRDDCQQRCLNETQFECRSAKFRVHTANFLATRFYDEPYSAQTMGSCVLSNSDRHLAPNSYRVSGYDDEYFENQCSTAITNEFCAFEEFEDVVLSHADKVFENTTMLQCQNQCEHSKVFKCRGYSLVPTNKAILQNRVYHCLLHSENTKLHGPKLLLEHSGAQYYERAPCLNISVRCSQKEMRIKFIPEVSFKGRLYMKGYSENPECYAIGNGTDVVALDIPLVIHKCGILQANSGPNRTLMSSTLILQYNQLVQTQADRIIKVGCIFGNSTKVVVGAGFTFTDDHIGLGSSVVNTTTTLPTVEMRIIDHATRGEVSDTQIGDELQLIIEMRPSKSGLDIMAGHLIAMTENGQDSILLLDDRGCPTNLDVFPSLTKIANNESIQLVSTFQAFKFSSSNIIRFSVIVQFCSRECPNIECNSRKKRGVDAGDIKNVNRTQFEVEGMKVIEQMPLEFVLIVRNTKPTRSDSLVVGEHNRLLVAGYDYMRNEVCIDYSLLLGLVILWILLQMILLISCIVLIKRYKRYYENRCISDSLEELHKNFGLGFSNLEGSRRVHFADGHLT